MGYETGHHAVHQEREIFPSASFQIWELGTWTLSPQQGTGNNTTQGTSVPLSRYLTPNDEAQETRSSPRTLEQQMFF